MTLHSKTALLHSTAMQHNGTALLHSTVTQPCYTQHSTDIALSAQPHSSYIAQSHNTVTQHNQHSHIAVTQHSHTAQSHSSYTAHSHTAVTQHSHTAKLYATACYTIIQYDAQTSSHHSPWRSGPWSLSTLYTNTA